MTRKAPSSKTHARCLDHVPHTYPSTGYVCITTNEPNRAADMVAFADDLAAIAAEHRTAEVARWSIPADPTTAGIRTTNAKTGKRGKTQPLVAHYGGTGHLPFERAADRASIARLSAELHARKGQPIPDAYARELIGETPTVARARKPARRRHERDVYAAPIVTPLPEPGMYRVTWPAPVEPEPEPEPEPAPGQRDDDGMPSAAGYAAAHDFGAVCDCGACVEPMPEPDPDASARLARFETDTAIGRRVASARKKGRGRLRSRARRVLAAPAESHPETVALAASIAEPAPVLAAVASAELDRPTCPRCGQTFRKTGTGLAWHVANRPDCKPAMPALAVAS